MERQKCVCFSEKGSAVCLQGEQDSKESNCRAHSEHLNLHASLDRSKSGTRATIVYIVYIHISNGRNDCRCMAA